MSALDSVKDVFIEYKNFASEKAKAERAHRLHIAGLRAQIAEGNETFKATWLNRKEEVRVNLDRAAVAALGLGHNAHSILNHIGSRNVTWIYQLRNAGIDIPLDAPEPQEHPLVEGVTWQHSEHTGTHGVLRSDTGLYKFYDLTDRETYFIVDSMLELVTGSSALYESRTRAELERMTELLNDILDNKYTGKLRLVTNPYTS